MCSKVTALLRAILLRFAVFYFIENRLSQNVIITQAVLRNQMIWHMKIHTGEGRHECPECKKASFYYDQNFFKIVFSELHIFLTDLHI